MGNLSFSLCGVSLQVKCPLYQSALISDLWRRFFVLKDGGGQPPFVEYSFGFPGNSIEVPPRGDDVYRSQRLLVLKTALGFYLRCDSSSLDLDVSNGRCQGVLTDEFWAQPLEYQREFFLLSFLMLLRPRGRFGLHANGLINNEAGYLISGEAGSGKTTLSLTLVREGWGFLSDDALMLHRTPQGIEALALRRGFSCTVQTISRFPEFKTSVDEAPAFLDGKKLVDIDRWRPLGFHHQCFPQVLLFPAITNEVDSRLVPTDPTQSMVALLQQSPGIMTERPWVIQQTDVLKLLVKQARCFQLLLGTDVYEAPQAVTELLSSVPVA